MIVILDYGMGNPSSIQRMLEKLGHQSILSVDVGTITRASGIILPGVGSFDQGMEALDSHGIRQILERKVLEEKVPFLGICLGMQLLLEYSEEGKLPGLAWIKGHAKKFNFTGRDDAKRLKVPHMGWNIVYPQNTTSLFKNYDEELRFYFVHSYRAVDVPTENILAEANYGELFPCGVVKENIFGLQFHPEKSHKFGLKCLSNFAELTQC